METNQEKGPSIEEQKKTVETIFQNNYPLKEGSAWCVVDQRWYEIWKKFSNRKENSENEEKTEINVPKLDNKRLVTKNKNEFFEKFKIVNEESKKCDSSTFIKIRRSMKQGVDYTIIPLELWDKFIEWYGGGPKIERHVINSRVEIFPFVFKVQRNSQEDKKKFTEIQISQHATFALLCTSICFIFSHQIKLAKKMQIGIKLVGRIYKTYSFEKYQNVALRTLFNRIYGQELIYALPNKSKTPSNGNSIKLDIPKNKLVHSMLGMQYKVHSTHYFQTKELYGGEGNIKYNDFCGLKNLGNTCYMNSALQCLLRVPKLREYFRDMKKIENVVKKCVTPNRRVASSFGKLMAEFFSHKHGYIFPREVKSVAGKLADRFAGFQQQDCAEFISVWLQGLHDDLNVVKKITKKKTQKFSEVPKKNEELEKRTWDSYVRKNESVIVEEFNGLFRNELFCEKCGKGHIKFEPFSTLSLPIPEPKLVTIKYFVQNNKEAPREYPLSIYHQNDHRNIKTIGDLMKDVLNIEMIKMDAEKAIQDVLMVGTRDKTICGIYKKKLSSKKIMHKQNALYHVPKKEGEKIIFVRNEEGYIDPFPIAVEIGVTTNKIMFEKSLILMMRYLRKGIQEDIRDVPGFKEASFDAFSLDEKETEDVGGDPIYKLYSRVDGKKNEIVYDENICILSGKKKEIILHIPKESLKKMYNLEELDKVLIDTKAEKSYELKKLVDNFSKKESIALKCSHCKSEKFSKKMDIWKLPKTLIVQMKRFRVNKSTNEKIQAFVDFPDVLCLEGQTPNKENDNKKFELFGICNHIGQTLRFGHYHSFVKGFNISKKEKEWIKMNDERLEDGKIYKTKDAYILFYSLIEKKTYT